jgi:hypothetical protein
LAIVRAGVADVGVALLSTKIIRSTVLVWAEDLVVVAFVLWMMSARH